MVLGWADQKAEYWAGWGHQVFRGCCAASHLRALADRIVRRVIPALAPAPAVPAAQGAAGCDATRYEIHHPQSWAGLTRKPDNGEPETIGVMGNVARFAAHRGLERRSGGGFVISCLSMIICQCKNHPNGGRGHFKRRQGSFFAGH